MSQQGEDGCRRRRAGPERREKEAEASNVRVVVEEELVQIRCQIFLYSKSQESVRNTQVTNNEIPVKPSHEVKKNHSKRH